MFSRTALAKLIDNSLLRPDATEEEIIRFCEISKQYHFASAVVLPYWVPVAAKLLKDSDVKLTTTVGFPLGCLPVACKVYEARQAIGMGAAELDMVINLAAARSGNFGLVRREIEEVVTVAKLAGLTEDGSEIITKVIAETTVLSREEQEKVCRIAEEARAEFVKTCTGFLGNRGATVEDVKFLRQAVGREMGVKAAGGIRTYEQALAMINAGANRIGTSSGMAIVEEYARAEKPIPEPALKQP